MAATLTDLERSAFEALAASIGGAAEAERTRYSEIRRKVFEAADQISAKEPDLTDHSSRHIEDVMQNAMRVLGPFELNPQERLLLCKSILFHDIGNTEGRKGHQGRVGPMHQLLNTEAAHYNERALVSMVAGAHTGKGDTIQRLDVESHYGGEAVRMQELAGILRFADEVSEGPQRTSPYRHQQRKYAAESLVYHDYAQVTSIHVDRGQGRVAVTYNLDDSEFETERLRELLKMCLVRTVKLDHERRYTGHYSACVRAFRSTNILFQFSHQGQLRNGAVRATLDDLAVPDPEDKVAWMEERFPDCRVEALLAHFPDLQGTAP